MITQISNLIGYQLGTSTTGDAFLYGTVSICCILVVFYLFDTVHDIVNRIGKRNH